MVWARRAEADEQRWVHSSGRPQASLDQTREDKRSSGQVRHVRMLGLCLVAAMTVAAVMATSALAAGPEWGKCEAKAKGKYKDANCTEKATKGSGTFEWVKGAKLKAVKFAGANVGSGGVLNTELKFCEGPENIQEHRIPKGKCEAEGGEITDALGENTAIECSSEANTGETVGKNSIKNVQVVFHGCVLFGSVPCSNGPNEGEIRVNPLKGELGYISKSEHKVGVLLTPAKKNGEFAKFDCAGILDTVVGVGNKKEGAWYEPENHGGYDGIISPIEPVNVMTSTYTQVFSANAETHQNIPSSFEGKHIDLLEDYTYNAEEPENHTTMWSPADEEITNENTAAEPGEIKG